jgi:hypothetical protein
MASMAAPNTVTTPPSKRTVRGRSIKAAHNT